MYIQDSFFFYKPVSLKPKPDTRIIDGNINYYVIQLEKNM